MTKAPGETVDDRITFEEWIEQRGMARLARQLGIHEHTIRGWRSGRSDPRVDQMRRIKRMTRGKIGYDQMIDRPCRSTQGLTSQLKKKLARRR